MLSGFFYYLITFSEAFLSVFGLRFTYEQPRYQVVATLEQSVEIRRYDARLAIEATVSDPDPRKAANAAFGLLFDYIVGANKSGGKIATTAPVASASERIAMTAPVQMAETGGAMTMRFFLPRSVVAAGAPAPLDQRLRLVEVPPETLAVLRYSGTDRPEKRAANTAALRAVLGTSAWRAEGDPIAFNYDPPFAIPFFRRNEVALAVVRP
jgi:hypothetical protein